MSIITIDRSLFSAADSADRCSGHDAPDSSSKSSHSEDFFMCKSTAVGLNIRSRRRSSCIKSNDDLQSHLKKILSLLRFGDYVQLVVRLQCDNPIPQRHRYCCVISTPGKQGTDESAILGVDVVGGTPSIGLVLPIWRDMRVNLYGDGGFKLMTKDTERQFKPVSVQALWAAFQAVNKACHVARENDHFSRGLTHDWLGHYHSLPKSLNYQIQEWLQTDDIDSFNRYSPPSFLGENATDSEKERARMESLLRSKLQDLMSVVDLEDVTVLQLRQRMEKELDLTLHNYRHFIENEVLLIYGRMDKASVIFDHLLLGTTFNASNREDLERQSVTHILNITREVDNFFPSDKYEYKNVRVFDTEEASLLPYWEETHRFINEAKLQGTCCLVHCKMGISRSAATVIAYVMKEHNWSLETALAFVKIRRPCIQPNAGFMRELRTYEGILEASSHRYNAIFQKARDSDSQNVALPPELTAGDPSTDDLLQPLDCDSMDEPDLNSHHPVGHSEAVDLEAELFMYKRYQENGDNRRQITSSTAKSVGSSVTNRQTRDSSIAEQQFPESSSVPLVVWDICDGKTSEADHNILAQNSHCLRQWHPDLVEQVNLEHLGRLTRKTSKAKEIMCTDERPDLVSIDQCSESEPVNIVETRLDANLDAVSSCRTHSDIDFPTCEAQFDYALQSMDSAVTATPGTVHSDTLQRRWSSADHVTVELTTETSSENMRKSSVTSPSSKFVLRMASKLSEPNQISTSLPIPGTTSESIIRSASMVRHSLNTNSELGVQPHTSKPRSRLSPSRIQTDSLNDPIGYWHTRLAIDPNNSGSHGSPNLKPPIFRSARSSADMKTLPSSLNRTQSNRSFRLSGLGRLRPDDSWIVVPTPSDLSLKTTPTTDANTESSPNEEFFSISAPQSTAKGNEIDDDLACNNYHPDRDIDGWPAHSLDPVSAQSV